ncbi:MAG: hypothetical protein J6Q67_06230 [Clostridia bacterium]|nr:hypothetical protein [Clostridia bacterium]
MSRSIEKMQKIRLAGHYYDKKWLMCYLRTHTASQAKETLPDVKTAKAVRSLAKRLGVRIRKETERTNYHYRSNTLCWTCANATNGNLCPWVKNFTPVEGWVAEPKKIFFNNVTIDSYYITECPLYRKDEREE